MLQRTRPSKFQHRQQLREGIQPGDLANIIEPRVQEIFQLIRQEVVRLGFKDMAGGYVLTGGTVSVAGCSQVVALELKTSVRIASPDLLV